MRIGFVSAWNERGSSYVTKQYMEALSENNELFLYERGSDNNLFIKHNLKLSICHGLKLGGTRINFRHFKRWYSKNKIDILFFNEQHDFDTVFKTKKDNSTIIVGTYVDYYKKSWIPFFKLYDFLICNTMRHFNVFEKLGNAFFVRWGTDVSLFNNEKVTKNNSYITFFHSAGMSFRKGTRELIDVFYSGHFGKKSKLIIHTQIPIKNFTDLTVDELAQNNIEIIEKTVPAPGLYHMGDVYVYPTSLDGLGLTIYEALSCGMPVITTDCQPMNEAVNNDVGRLIKVSNFISRDDGYYWPLCVIDQESLASALSYYINNNFDNQRLNARKRAVELYDWGKQKSIVRDIFANDSRTKITQSECKNIEKKLFSLRKIKRKELFLDILPDFFVSFIRNLKD